jgi:hypothetical protein
MVQIKNKAAATLPEKIFNEMFIEVNLDPEGKPEQEKSQVKQKENQSGRKEGKRLRDTQNFVLNDIGHPVLLLLFDLGIETKPKNPVQVSRSSGKDPVIWVIHSHGHGEDVFGCVDNMGCDYGHETFFLAVQPENGYLDMLCQRNKIFSDVDENFRFVMEDDETVEGARDKDEDTELVDTELVDA